MTTMDAVRVMRHFELSGVVFVPGAWPTAEQVLRTGTGKGCWEVRYNVKDPGTKVGDLTYAQACAVYAKGYLKPWVIGDAGEKCYRFQELPGRPPSARLPC